MKKIYKINKPEGVELKSANVTINNDEIVVEVEFNDEFQPKDGDFIKFECCDREGLFIYKKGKYDDYCGCYCGISSEFKNNGLNGELILSESDCHESKIYCKFASKEEIEFFLKRLKDECNKQWNPETKKLENIRWRANKGETFYMIDSLCNIVKKIATLDSNENELFKIGNYFKTYVDAQLQSNKLKEIFKNFN